MASTATARYMWPTISWLAKHHDFSALDYIGKVASSASAAKKRPTLSNVTNQRNGTGSVNSGRGPLPESSKIAQCATKIVSITEEPLASTNSNLLGAILPISSSVKQDMVAVGRSTFIPKSDVVLSKTHAAPVSCSMDVSPDKSDSLSVSMDESISTCDSLKSPDVEHVDYSDVAAVDSIESKASNMLCISDHVEIAENLCKRDALASLKSCDKIVDVDENLDDPQLCATIACDIYKNLRASEAIKRPATNFMERVIKDINANMCAILTDVLVEVAEEYRLVKKRKKKLDCYLSGNVMDEQRLQLLGIACMTIASKYEEICATQVEEFCYITDNTYSKDELRMFQRDSRDRTVLQPTPAAVIDMLPSVAYIDNPSASFAAKFKHTSLNKNRCSINQVLAQCTTKILSIRKGPSASTNSDLLGAILPISCSVKQDMVAVGRSTFIPKSDVVLSKTLAAPVSCSMDVSPDKSDSLSVSMDESMSTCDSLKSPDVEHLDYSDVAAVDSIESMTVNMLCISDHVEIAGNLSKRDALASLKSCDKIVDVDENLDDPQLCATIACDIYKHLRALEAMKMPTTNFMERVIKNINASMRAIIIDWLVEVAKEYRIVKKKKRKKKS